MRIALDTNVLAYAEGANGAVRGFQQRCAAALATSSAESQRTPMVTALLDLPMYVRRTGTAAPGGTLSGITKFTW